MKRKLIVRHGRQVVLAFCGLLMGAMSLQSCEDPDNPILTGQPDWLGNSIYERLQADPDGQKYTYLLRLIDDLGQKEVLSHTGSKTVFAPDDDAFNRWFSNNEWGVGSYEQLTTAQKTLLLNTTMVNNAYLIELLSNSAGNPPTKGASMRRETAVTIQDSVPTLVPDSMPATLAWKQHQNQNKQMHMLMDATAAPIIHLLPEFMKTNEFTSQDVEILTNGRSSSVNSSFVNGVEITKGNITCKNGYIHKVADVLEPLINMARIIRNQPDLSRWSKLLDRFSAPYFNRTATNDYNRLHGTTDSVFSLRYISNISVGGDALSILPDGKSTLKGSLSFDPGWNQYVPNVSNTDYHNDAGAMLVPTNAALETWWQTGGGKPIREQYTTWENVPDNIIADLINNNMMSSFKSSIPSNFEDIVDDAQMPMMVKPEDVKHTYLGCNGVIYQTDKVFAPSSFSSVAFPAQINSEVMNVIYWAIENIDNGAFKSLLSSMEATYSLLLPSNQSLLTYIDPTLYGNNTMMLYQFYYDTDPEATKDNRVKAKRYEMTKDKTTGQWQSRTFETPVTPTSVLLKNRLKDLLNSIIIVGELKSGQEYYRTRGGSVVRILNPNVAGSMTVEGGYQLEGHLPVTDKDGVEIENNVPIIVAANAIYDQTAATNGKGNGMSYRLDTSIPMAASKSVSGILSDAAYPEFTDFYDLMLNSAVFTSTLTGSYTDESGVSKKVTAYPNKGQENMSLFDGYHYTVYVPDGAVIKEMQANGYLPTTADLSIDWPNDTLKNIADTVTARRLKNFVSYHVQDNSVFIGGEAVTDHSYESSKVNPENNRFFSLKVTSSNSDMKVWGQYKCVLDGSGKLVANIAIDKNGNSVAGQQLNVVTGTGRYNIMAREFWNSSEKADKADALNDYNKQIYSTSDAVIHLIDGVLLFSTNQMPPDFVPTRNGGDPFNDSAATYDYPNYNWGQLTKWQDEVYYKYYAIKKKTSTSSSRRKR